LLDLDITHHKIVQLYHYICVRFPLGIPERGSLAIF